jgi:hypothetical protein
MAYTLLNAVKPLTIDDTAYFFYARQAAQHPLDPYGFAVFWWYEPMVGNDVLAPPLLAYWWSLAIRLFGENEFLWKLWLFPFAALFTLAIYSLARRFARGLELPLSAFLVLSPTFLPSLNLMLDVPALAMSLAALELFCRGCDRRSFGVTTLSGLVAGLAMQTKYTAFLGPVAMLLYALFYGRLRYWPAAAVLAALVFLSWELLMSMLYGESHFLLQTRYQMRAAGHEGFKWHLFSPLVTNLGCIAWGTALLGLAALRVPRSWLIAGIVASLAALVMIGCFESDLIPNKSLFASKDLFNPDEKLPQEHLLFGIFGTAGFLISAVVIWSVCRMPGVAGWWLHRWDDVLYSEQLTMSQRLAALWRYAPWRAHPAAWFLVCWLALEILGYFLLTPFPAVRRLMGVVVVASLVAGRLAALTGRSESGRINLWIVISYNALVGGLFFTIDLAEARAQKEAVERTATQIRAEDPDATIWFTGHWAVQYYGEKAGFRPIVSYDLDPKSLIPLGERTQFHEGDWIVVPRRRWIENRYVGVDRQPFAPDDKRTEFRFMVAVKDFIPFHTIICFYSGRTALEHHSGNRVEFEVRQVTADHWARAQPD